MTFKFDENMAKQMKMINLNLSETIRTEANAERSQYWSFYGHAQFSCAKSAVSHNIELERVNRGDDFIGDALRELCFY